MRKFDRELTQIRIRCGASPAQQWTLYYKHAASILAYGFLKRISAFARAYEERKKKKPSG